MTTQNYLIIESNVVTNNVVWDGNTTTWRPPANSIQLVDATTPAMIWQPVYETDPTTQKIIVVNWVLEEVLGAGDIGFTWNGSVLTTNQPKPPVQTQS
jgi:hypothetical protein